MDNPELKWELISRYVSGECSEDERRKVEKWMNSDPRNKETITLLQKAWNSTGKSEESWDVDSAWLRYNIRYGKDFTDSSRVNSKQPDEMNYISRVHTAHRRKSNFMQWGAVVAAAAMICIAFLFIYQSGEDKSSEINTLPQEIVAKHGQRLHLRLSDGTKVILNSASNISAPEIFPDSIRSVHLEGEAVFDVATDSTRPFLIHTAHSVTEVLGTRFGVKAYPDDEQVEVVVEEGKVAIRPNIGRDIHTGRELTKNQMGRISKEGKLTVSEVNDWDKFMGWTEGKLVFSEDPLNKVETKLERWYDIDIVVRPDNLMLSGHQLTATFSDKQPLSEVLEAIVLSLDLEFKKESDGTFIIYQ